MAFVRYVLCKVKIYIAMRSTKSAILTPVFLDLEFSMWLFAGQVKPHGSGRVRSGRPAFFLGMLA